MPERFVEHFLPPGTSSCRTTSGSAAALSVPRDARGQGLRYPKSARCSVALDRTARPGGANCCDFQTHRVGG